MQCSAKQLPPNLPVEATPVCPTAAARHNLPEQARLTDDIQVEWQTLVVHHFMHRFDAPVQAHRGEQESAARAIDTAPRLPRTNKASSTLSEPIP
eukprot:3562807-Amphidinium_carterae.1